MTILLSLIQGDSSIVQPTLRNCTDLSNQCNFVCVGGGAGGGGMLGTVFTIHLPRVTVTLSLP